MENKVKEKLLVVSSRNILNKIIDLVKEKDEKTIHMEYALEKFENYVNRFDIRISDNESDYLKKLRLDMYDNNGLLPKNIVKENEESSVTFVDFKNKIKIKP